MPATVEHQQHMHTAPACRWPYTSR